MNGHEIEEMLFCVLMVGIIYWIPVGLACFKMGMFWFGLFHWTVVPGVFIATWILTDYFDVEKGPYIEKGP